MTQTQLQLLISFETLAEAVLVLELEDKLRLRALLDQEILRRTEQRSVEEVLIEQGIQFPLKVGLQGSIQPFSTDRSDISINS